MRVEVALIISTLPDVPDTEESSRKEKAPKEGSRTFQPGHMMNSHMTVIRTDGELLKKNKKDECVHDFGADQRCWPCFFALFSMLNI